MNDGAACVQIDNLRLKYPGEDGLLFKGLSLSISPGERVLLLGPSGCGKSTLLQVLSGLVPHSIELPMKHDGARLPERAGYVFQDPDAQFCMPYVDEELAFVMENLRVPPAEMPARMTALLEAVGLRLEDPHTLIQSLSQGMKQRLAIASALALSPDVWLLDEPTALLDSAGTKQVWDALKTNTAGRTVVIVEHKIAEIVGWIDRVVVLSADAAIVADGKPADVFERHKDRLIADGIWYPGVWEDYLLGKRSSSPGEPAANADKLISRKAGTPLLQLDGFRGYRGGSPAIVAERAEVHAGDWVCVVGENGAGKSSLLLAIMKLIRTEGAALVNGRDRKSTRQLADEVAFVFQNPEFQFIAGSVEEEIGYSIAGAKLSREARSERTRDVLDQFQLLPYRHRHPYQLSMGQKRRLSVAVSIERGQKLLLLDEPTFGLDARNTFAMLERLTQLRREGYAIIMITHDEEIVRHYASQIWRVASGRLAQITDKAVTRA